MSEKTIQIVIDENGNLRVDAIGFLGSECEDIQKKISEAMGLTESKEDKPDKFSHQSCKTNVQQKQK